MAHASMLNMPIRQLLPVARLRSCSIGACPCLASPVEECHTAMIQILLPARSCPPPLTHPWPSVRAVCTSCTRPGFSSVSACLTLVHGVMCRTGTTTLWGQGPHQMAPLYPARYAASTTPHAVLRYLASEVNAALPACPWCTTSHDGLTACSAFSWLLSACSARCLWIVLHTSRGSQSRPERTSLRLRKQSEAQEAQTLLL